MVSALRRSTISKPSTYPSYKIGLIAAAGSAALLSGAWVFQAIGYAPCIPCRSSFPSMLRSSTTSTMNATSIHELLSNSNEPPLSPSGGCFVPHRFTLSLPSSTTAIQGCSPVVLARISTLLAPAVVELSTILKMTFQNCTQNLLDLRSTMMHISSRLHAVKNRSTRYLLQIQNST
jgi:hypothetical protein